LKSFEIRPLARLALVVPLGALVFSAALRPAQAVAANPCAKLPAACHYTWDPVARCCVADPRFDCFDVC
jgi:hypothetical protein